MIILRSGFIPDDGCLLCECSCCFAIITFSKDEATVIHGIGVTIYKIDCPTDKCTNTLEVKVKTNAGHDATS